MPKEATKEVEMKDEESKAQESPKPQPLAPVEEILANVVLIERAVSTLEPRFSNRVLRGLTSLRRNINEKVLKDAVNAIYGGALSISLCLSS